MTPCSLTKIGIMSNYLENNWAILYPPKARMTDSQSSSFTLSNRNREIVVWTAESETWKDYTVFSKVTWIGSGRQVKRQTAGLFWAVIPKRGYITEKPWIGSLKFEGNRFIV